MNIITRFAPSPTGMLHVGNARTAIINYLLAKKLGGKFILRIDNTDKLRSKQKYEEQIKKDLTWLGLSWDNEFDQLSRIEHYNNIKSHLIKSGYLYPCYETPEELEVKRKSLINRNLPPIYDRSALHLSDDKINSYKEEGRNPHYRFKITDKNIKWHDLIKGEVIYEGKYLSDPVLVRRDGSFTYMLCSTIDDIDYHISHILRGDDHISNTAIQIQLFEVLGSHIPSFGHMGLVKTKDSKISKRTGGFEIEYLREHEGLEALTISNFFSRVGSSLNIPSYTSLTDIIDNFDISKLSKNSTVFDIADLYHVNEKILHKLNYRSVANILWKICGTEVTEEFWLACRTNLKKLSDIKLWWDVCYDFKNNTSTDSEYMKLVASLLPSGTLDKSSWKAWTNIIKDKTGRKGKDLYMPLRIAITGIDYGPELNELLPIIGNKDLLRRLV